MSAADAEKLRTAPRWRLTLQPRDQIEAQPLRHPGVRHLPPRILTLSHVHELGTRLATTIMAQEPYQIRLGVSSGRTVPWTELRTVIPEELTMVTITATGHLLEHPDNSPERGVHHQTAEITLYTGRAAYLRVFGSPQSPEDQHRYNQLADDLAAYFVGLGRPRPDRGWLVPVLFWLGLAAAVLPLVWLMAFGSLPWLALPFIAATTYVSAAYLSEQVARWSDRRLPERRASVIVQRPIEEVRRDAEAHRQKVRIGWITAAVTGPIAAAVGAVLAAILKS